MFIKVEVLNSEFVRNENQPPSYLRISSETKMGLCPRLRLPSEANLHSWNAGNLHP